MPSSLRQIVPIVLAFALVEFESGVTVLGTRDEQLHGVT